MIHVQDLQKHYTVTEKEAGFLGSLRAFVRPRTKVVKAVDGVSFDIAAGERVGFLGANGAGKTTTLKMLSGLLHPTGGSVQVSGFTPFQRKTDFLKKITLVMGQKQQLIWDLPAQDSFLVNQAIFEIGDLEFAATLKEFTEILELDGILKKQVRKLSLGERMKCELAAALLHRPKVLFLDEPTIGLDVNMQVRIREFIAEYNRRFEATVILTSHYMADVTALCERIIVVEKGQIVLDGGIESLMQRAQNKIIKLEFSHLIPRAQLERYGTVQEQDGLSAQILIPRAQASQVASRLLGELPIADVTIEDPPIESIIGEIMSEARVNQQNQKENQQNQHADLEVLGTTP